MIAPPHLVTERLIIRLATPDDAPPLLDFFRTNDAHVARTQNHFRPELLAADSLIATLLVRRADFEADRAVHTFFFDRHTALPIGFANLTNIVRGYFQACYLGYALAEHAQGQGLMHEALAALLRYAFGPLALHRVMANHTPDNHCSANVLKRLGFRQEGLAPRYLRIHNEWRDHILTALHADDPQSSKSSPPNLDSPPSSATLAPTSRD